MRRYAYEINGPWKGEASSEFLMKATLTSGICTVKLEVARRDFLIKNTKIQFIKKIITDIYFKLNYSITNKYTLQF
ncbi:hypothetical protein GbCGDNIH6_8233 [Granulibacter bethesdensis]|nr:hypothetical protein GbCGDNIH6_8233 [Granulibacter bethesdensis]